MAATLPVMRAAAREWRSVCGSLASSLSTRLTTSTPAIVPPRPAKAPPTAPTAAAVRADAAATPTPRDMFATRPASAMPVTIRAVTATPSTTRVTMLTTPSTFCTSDRCEKRRSGGGTRLRVPVLHHVAHAAPRRAYKSQPVSPSRAWARCKHVSAPSCTPYSMRYTSPAATNSSNVAYERREKTARRCDEPSPIR